MIRVQLAKGERTIRFKSKFSELTLVQLKEYMRINKGIELLLQSWGSVINSTDTTQEYEDLYLVDLNDMRLELINLLCMNPKRLSKQLDKYILAYDSVRVVVEKIYKSFGSFSDYWEKAPAIGSFVSFSPFPKRYTVHSVGGNTVQRDKIAAFRLKQAFDDTNAIGSDNWDNVVQFIATVIRPAKQVKEIGFTQKAFVNGKNLKGYSPSDSHAYYLEQLEQQIKAQTPVAERLKCGVAIGIIKYFWLKKKN